MLPHDEDNINEEPVRKKIRLDNKINKDKTNNHINKGETLDELESSSNVIEKCNICKQYKDVVQFYNGHPNEAVDEYIALTDDKLMLFTGNESEINGLDERPTNKITQYSVYDTNGHLCPFDTGLVELDVPLYFSGYVKPIYDENPLQENGIPTKDLGPINEWYAMY